MSFKRVLPEVFSNPLSSFLENRVCGDVTGVHAIGEDEITEPLE